MKDFFSTTKKIIAPFLDSFLAKQAKLYSPVNNWSADTLRRLRASVARGKMVRGSLVVLTYRLAGKRVDDTCLRLAAAMELVQVALLVHDDIMDGDAIRRGEPSMHKQYEALSKQAIYRSPAHVGEGLGICVGDVAIFLSFKLIAGAAKKHPELVRLATEIFASELTSVGFAQMDDIFSGAMPGKRAPEQILNLYRYKTARYTFSLPFLLGGLTTHLPTTTIKKLDEFGECLGLIFQIKDDELGMFGTEESIGKSVGADIREGKKTLYHYFLFHKATTSERSQLQKIFGNPRPTTSQLELVQSLINKYGISYDIEQVVERQVQSASRLLKSLKLPTTEHVILNGLLDFNLKRVR